MTAPLRKSPSDLLPFKLSRSRSRGRSRSPNDPDLHPPVEIRSRSRLSSMQESDPEPASEDLPLYLIVTRREVQDRFLELELRQRDRLLESLQNADPQHRWAQEQDLTAKLRNRYINVQPWANNRIHLRVPEGYCDYINASPIVLKGSKSQREKKYITTQGPKLGQFNHIWRMVWNETAEPAVIVMLTRTFEAGREKCFPYFPETFDQATLAIEDEDEFGDGFQASVELLECYGDLVSRSTIRKLELSVNGESRIVWHLLFEGWPDFAVPEFEERQALLELIKLSAEKNTTPENPRIVHCSAGVGRSGTFIALDHLLEELSDGALDGKRGDADADPVLSTVDGLREQRMTMVQSDAQLHFIYQVLKEQWMEKEVTNKLIHVEADGELARAEGQRLENLAAIANAEMAQNVEEHEFSSAAPATEPGIDTSTP
ncbi:MAG: hypothetical protein M1833_005023 [Piccolia ochrophora]|nr:MAG: hypothetical protein M1833_005023 [Piccolia ochrophora]